MLKYIIILLILISPCRIFASEETELEERYIETIALTFHGFAKEGSDAIWPRFHLTDRPAVFHFQNGHVYGFGLTSFSPVWEKRYIHQSFVLFSSEYQTTLPPLQPHFPFEGQRAFVMSLDQGARSPYLPLLTFVHERFHLFQFRAFPKEKVVEAEIADYQNVDLLSLIELEHRLLTSFLKTEEKAGKLEYLKDFLAINQMRRQQLHPHTILWEDHQQKMEGLADYVSVKTFQVFPYIPNFKAEEFLLKMRGHKNGDIVNTQDAWKGRHYFVGAALAWALDLCDVQNWKLRIEKENISLQALLESVLTMTEEERNERILRVQERLQLEEIRGQIELVMEKEKKEKEEVLQEFEGLDGIVIHMGTPSGRMSSGGRHEKSCQVDRKKALMADTSVAATQDQLWTLRFYGIPLIFEEPNGDRMFKLHPRTRLQINGQEMSLHAILQGDQRELAFSSLSLKHEHCELESKRPGKLSVEEGMILFQFY